jgi:hypothetical protein
MHSLPDVGVNQLDKCKSSFGCGDIEHLILCGRSRCKRPFQVRRDHFLIELAILRCVGHCLDALDGTTDACHIGDCTGQLGNYSEQVLVYVSIYRESVWAKHQSKLLTYTKKTFEVKVGKTNKERAITAWRRLSEGSKISATDGDETVKSSEVVNT